MSTIKSYSILIFDRAYVPFRTRGRGYIPRQTRSERMFHFPLAVLTSRELLFSLDPRILVGVNLHPP